VKGRNATVRQETIKNYHSKLLTAGSVTDARRSGRPSTSRSEENVALVRDMFTRSQRKSTRQAAREIGLSRHTVRTVLKKDLNFRQRKPHYVQELTPEDCDRRMEYVELMLGWHDDWPKLFANILWSNEAVFHIGGFVNRRNCPYWAAHDTEVTVEKMQNRPKVTVWCGMTATRVIGPYLLRDTMITERYLQMMEDYVWSVVSGWENIDELVFMHDGAPPHFALSVLPGWIRSFRDVGWDDEDLTNGLQEVQISRPVTFSCGAGQRRCTGQNFAQWNNWRTGFGTLSPTSHTTSCRRLWIPSPVV